MKNSLERNFSRSFSQWKIWAGIAIGLLVTLFLIYSAWNEAHFAPVADGNGTHIWIDMNRDGKIQSSDIFQEKKGGDFRRQTAQDVVNDIDWNLHLIGWLSLAIIGVIARDFFYMLRIRLLTRKQLSWRSAFDTIMLWEFSSALAPGVMSGSTVAMFILNREKIALGRATAIVFSATFLDNLFFVVFVPLVVFGLYSIAHMPDSFFNNSAIQVFWFAYSLFAMVATFFFVLLFVRPTMGRALFKTLSTFRFLNRWQKQLQHIGEDITQASLSLQQERFAFWLKAFAYTSASWLSRYLVINALIEAFYPIDGSGHLSIVSKQLVLWLTMRVSPTPGGSGVAEYVFTSLMSEIGASLVLITLIAVCWRMLSYFPYLVIGSMLLPGWLKRTAE